MYDVHAAPDEHKAVMDDLAKRRTYTVLLLAMLKGKTVAVFSARKQRQEEQWAAEYLAEVKRAELSASMDLGGRLTVVRGFYELSEDDQLLTADTVNPSHCRVQRSAQD